MRKAVRYPCCYCNRWHVLLGRVQGDPLPSAQAEQKPWQYREARQSSLVQCYICTFNSKVKDITNHQTKNSLPQEEYSWYFNCGQ